MGARNPKGSRGCRKIHLAPKAWERQVKEPIHLFEAFCVYRDMPSRSIEGVAAAVGRNPQTLKSLSQSWQWIARAQAWDIEMDRRIRDRGVDAIAKMHERQINVAMGMQAAVASETRALVQTIRNMDEQAEEAGIQRTMILRMKDYIRLYEVATKQERLSRGESTDNVEIKAHGISDELANEIRTRIFGVDPLLK